MYCTLDEVKRSMGGSVTETGFDDFLQELVDDVGERINSMLPHTDLRQTPYTEFHDGGRASIILIRRPLISVTTVHDDTEHSFGATTLVAATDYFTDRAELAIIRKSSGDFQIGTSNLKVVYEAGFETTPPFVRRLAVEMVIAAWKRRSDPYLKSSGHREGTWTRYDPEGEETRMKRVLAPLL